jgi:hypothetical protein
MGFAVRNASYFAVDLESNSVVHIFFRLITNHNVYFEHIDIMQHGCCQAEEHLFVSCSQTVPTLYESSSKLRDGIDEQGKNGAIRKKPEGVWTSYRALSPSSP